MIKIILSAAAALLLGAVGSANATLVLSSDVNGLLFSCADNAACDTNPAVGTLAIGNQNFGGVIISGSVQQQFTGAANTLNTSSLTVQNTTGSTASIKVVIGATNFTGPNNVFDASGSATFNADIGGTLNVNYYDDPANRQSGNDVNTIFGDVVATASKAVTVNSDSFSFDKIGSVNDPALFSMALEADGTIIAGGEIVSRGQTLSKTEVPEPASLLLLGTSLLGLGAVVRRRRKGVAHYA